jgi:hypothetical protein
VQRIFSSLAIVSSILLAAALVLGLNIGDAVRAAPEKVTYHMWTAMGALGFACLVHAIVFTYFMGTSRWMEETSRAYSLGASYYEESRQLKYRAFLGISVCIAFVVLTVVAGAAADPATPASFDGFLGLRGDKLHLLIAVLNFAVNCAVYVGEFVVLHRNGVLVDEVLAKVRRIREEHQLPVA